LDTEASVEIKQKVERFKEMIKENKIYVGRPSVLMWGKNEKGSCGIPISSSISNIFEQLDRPTSIKELSGIEV
jgi:hypothetical protein